jgi:hypothetical protein
MAFEKARKCWVSTMLWSNLMFVRVKKIGAYEYLYLVENGREGGRHIQRVVRRWNEVDRQDIAPLQLWSPGFGSDSVRGDPAAPADHALGSALVTRAEA